MHKVIGSRFRLENEFETAQMRSPKGLLLVLSYIKDEPCENSTFIKTVMFFFCFCSVWS